MTATSSQREPREVVVDHGDGTVSPLMEAKFLELIDGIVRARRAGDVMRELRTLTPIRDMIR
ncbi:hypothetical protein [Bradyrhizobium sp. BR 10289]|uniref:hypothetical protein n=1 Tax=Bradyrhizobium sp. BR 10289 TaxID=2749993 RepID=UPI001C6521FB|nr:hypothetical protein [Bradyrhizobium sp. BR 10289]MBW7968122.1 hypothetical protein [Bradyrhizobium sp. BR 10289]